MSEMSERISLNGSKMVCKYGLEYTSGYKSDESELSQYKAIPNEQS